MNVCHVSLTYDTFEVHECDTNRCCHWAGFEKRFILYYFCIFVVVVVVVRSTSASINCIHRFGHKCKQTTAQLMVVVMVWVRSNVINDHRIDNIDRRMPPAGTQYCAICQMRKCCRISLLVDECVRLCECVCVLPKLLLIDELRFISRFINHFDHNINRQNDSETVPPPHYIAVRWME